MRTVPVPTLRIDCAFSYAGVCEASAAYQEHYREEPTVIIAPQSRLDAYHAYLTEMKSLIPFLTVIPGGHDWWAVGGPRGILYVRGA